MCLPSTRQSCPNPEDLVSQVRGPAALFHAPQLCRCGALLDTVLDFGFFGESLSLAGALLPLFPTS
jgi:hypothetical protein